MPTTTTATWPASWGPAPRWATRRTPERPSYGPAVGRVAERLGSGLFPWQQYVVDVALEVLPDGSWAYDSVVVLAPRRSGKTKIVESVTAHRCGQPRFASTWMTAQSRESAVKRWMEAAGADDERPSGLWHSPLRPLLSKPLRGVGNEKLVWKGSGSIFRPFSPVEDAMHGEDPDLVWIDELWAFTDEQRREIQQGYRPAWSVKSGQEWMISAAGTARSGWMKWARQLGRAVVEADGRARTAFFEWCVPIEVDGRPVYELDDDARLVQLVIDNHPRRDHGLRRGFVTDELEGLGKLAFLRAYGGIDEDAAGTDTVIPQQAFRRARVEERIPDVARVGLSVAVDPESREASVSAAWRNARGQALTEVLARRPGTLWAAPYVRERVDRNDIGAVAVNNVGPARDVADALEQAGVALLRLPASDYAAACRRLQDGMVDVPVGGEPLVTHDGDPDLVDAVRAAGWRTAGPGSKVWASASGEPITVLESHTLAVWAADHMPRKPTGKQRIITPFH